MFGLSFNFFIKSGDYDGNITTNVGTNSLNPVQKISIRNMEMNGKEGWKEGNETWKKVTK